MTKDQRRRGPKLRGARRARFSHAGDRHDPRGSQPHDRALVCRARRDACRRAVAADVLLGDPRRPLPAAVGEHLCLADRSHLPVGRASGWPAAAARRSCWCCLRRPGSRMTAAGSSRASVSSSNSRWLASASRRDVVQVVLAADRDGGAGHRPGRQPAGPVGEAGQPGRVEGHRVLLARRVADSAAWSMRTAVQQRAGDRFLAVQDGADRRAADQVGQAADHAAGALVQVTGLM